jgi:hypothetical protein
MPPRNTTFGFMGQQVPTINAYLNGTKAGANRTATANASTDAMIAALTKL